MLKGIRKHKRTTIFIIMGLAALFILWGVGGTLGQKPERTAAGTLFGQPVPYHIFQRAYQELAQEVRAQYGFALPEEFLVPQVWDRLLLAAEAKRQRIHVADGDVIAALQAIPQFQKDGQFYEPFYRDYLTWRGESVHRFEAHLREQLAVDQLRQQVLRDVTVSDDEVAAEHRRRNERAVIQYVLVTPEPFKRDVTNALTDEALQQYLTAHQDQLQAPEAIRLTYLHISQEGLPEDEAERQQAWNERRRALEAADVEGLTLEQQAQRLEVSLQETGWFTREEPPEPLAGDAEIVAKGFQLPAGERSQPMETTNGLYVLRVDERRPARPLTLEDTRTAITEQLVVQRSREQAKQTADALRAQLADQLQMPEASFRDLVKTLGHPIHTPEPFTRQESVPGLTDLSTASLFELVPGALSPVLEASEGLVIAQLQSIQPPDEQTLAPLPATLKDELLQQKQQAHFRAWLVGLRAKANLKSYLDSTQNN